MKNGIFWQKIIVNFLISSSSIMSENMGDPASWLLQLLSKDWFSTIWFDFSENTHFQRTSYFFKSLVFQTS